MRFRHKKCDVGLLTVPLFLKGDSICHNLIISVVRVLDAPNPSRVHIKNAHFRIMDKSDLSDPSDWTHTALSSLYPLDSNLRCLICKDFYTAPVITTCLHTFCSLCIRRSLSSEAICPACRTTNISDSGLRQNKVVADLVENFVAVRY